MACVVVLVADPRRSFGLGLVRESFTRLSIAGVVHSLKQRPCGIRGQRRVPHYLAELGMWGAPRSWLVASW